METKCFKGWSDNTSNTSGRCCCNCKHHKEDFYHCTTVDRVAHSVDHATPLVGCVCSLHKGWICAGMEGDGGRLHSDWSEHGMCEMHERK